MQDLGVDSVVYQRQSRNSYQLTNPGPKRKPSTFHNLSVRAGFLRKQRLDELVKAVQRGAIAVCRSSSLLVIGAQVLTARGQ